MHNHATTMTAREKKPSGNWTKLRDWFYMNGCFVQAKNNDRRQKTHLLLDGGSIHVNVEKEDEFILQYTRSIMSAERNYVVECRTPIFRFLMDLDIMEEHEVQLDDLCSIVARIQKTLWEFYAKEEERHLLSVIMSTTEAKQITKQATIDRPSICLVKTGVHLIWPDICVDNERAQTLRRAVVFDLTQTFGKRSEQNSWEEVVDSAVYKANGLRMIGSRKCVTCSSCRNNAKKKGACKNCNGVGWFDEGRVYVPKLVMRCDGTYDVDEMTRLGSVHKHYMIRRTTIRRTTMSSIPESPHFSIQKYYIDNLDPENPRKSGQRLRRLIENQDLIRVSASDSPPASARTKSVVVPTTDERFKCLKAFIRKEFYGNPEITSLTYTETMVHYLAASSSRYCMNKGAEHMRNTIYFSISISGVSQRCHCGCDVLRKFSTPCKNFGSIRRPLGKKLFALMFPGKTQFISKAAVYGATTQTQTTSKCKFTHNNVASQRNMDDVLRAEIAGYRSVVKSPLHREYMTGM